MKQSIFFIKSRLEVDIHLINKGRNCNNRLDYAETALRKYIIKIISWLKFAYHVWKIYSISLFYFTFFMWYYLKNITSYHDSRFNLTVCIDWPWIFPMALHVHFVKKVSEIWNLTEFFDDFSTQVGNIPFIYHAPLSMIC